MGCIFTAIECHSLTAPFNGIIVGGILPSYIFGSVVEFSCSRGFELRGSSSVSCQEDGSWSSTTPLCNGIMQYVNQ